MKVDQCFERLFCNLATQEYDDVEKLVPILNILVGETKLSSSHRKKYRQLKNAKSIGEHWQNVNVCDTSFTCTYTGPGLISSMFILIPK